MRLILLLMLLPIILYPLEKSQILLGQLLRLLIVIFFLLGRREKFIQVPLQLLNIVAFLYLLHGFDLLIIFEIHALVLVLAVLGQFGELWLTVVFGLDMCVQCRVTEVGFAAVARKVAAVFIVSSPSLTLQVVIVKVESFALGW